MLRGLGQEIARAKMRQYTEKSCIAQEMNVEVCVKQLLK